MNPSFSTFIFSCYINVLRANLVQIIFKIISNRSIECLDGTLTDITILREGRPWSNDNIVVTSLSPDLQNCSLTARHVSCMHG